MPYLHNTTFIVAKNKVPAFLEWAKGVYLPAIKESGHFDHIMMTHILTEVDPNAVNYAIQMRTESPEESAQWHRDVATLLKDDVTARLGNGNVLFFATDMEVIYE